MNRPRRAKRAPFTTLIAVAAAVLGCAALIVSPAVASAEEAAPTATVHYTKETQQDYERQLAAGEIQSATFNKKIRSLHLTLKNGDHVLFIYPAHDQPKLAAELEKKGITITVLKKTEADKEAAKPVHHKLRYIAGGILVVIVIVVATVLVIDRKRKQQAE